MRLDMAQVVRSLEGPVREVVGGAGLVSLVEPGRLTTPVLRIDPAVPDAAKVVIMIDNDALLVTCADAAQFVLEGSSVNDFHVAVLELVAKVARGDFGIEFKGSRVRRVCWKQDDAWADESVTRFAPYGVPS